MPSPRDQLTLTQSSPAASSDDSPLARLTDPDSPGAEQFRCLRYSLSQTLSHRGCNVIAVSSPDRGSGKTTTAINLAVALEESGVFRVLLVDADLRAAAIAERLALGPVVDDGLDTALADWSMGLCDVVRQASDAQGLSIAPTAARPDVAGRLLASPRFAVLLKEAREQYDFVVIDTPPLLPAADCRAMAPWIDGFLVVVAAHRTSRRALAHSLDAMREDQVLGLVFNEDEVSP